MSHGGLRRPQRVVDFDAIRILAALIDLRTLPIARPENAVWEEYVHAIDRPFTHLGRRRRRACRRCRLQPAQAQDAAANYPNKPIRLIVPFAAGGGNDIFARLVGAKFGDILGQQLVIENRAAAGGRPAAEFVANQPADGYTLFVGASGVMSIASAVYPNSPIIRPRASCRSP